MIISSRITHNPQLMHYSTDTIAFSMLMMQASPRGAHLVFIESNVCMLQCHVVLHKSYKWATLAAPIVQSSRSCMVSMFHVISVARDMQILENSEVPVQDTQASQSNDNERRPVVKDTTRQHCSMPTAKVPFHLTIDLSECI